MKINYQSFYTRKFLCWCLAVGLGLVGLSALIVIDARNKSYECQAANEVISDPAATLWYNVPASVVMDGKLYITFVGGKTPFGYSAFLRYVPRIGEYLNDFVVSFGDYHAKMIGYDSDGKLIHNQNFHEWPSPDDHAASALIEAEGTLVAAYSHHDSKLIVRTGGPEWQDEIVVDNGATTYPKLLNTGGRLYLIYARTKPGKLGGRDLISRSSTDRGRSWSPPKTLVTAVPGNYIYASRLIAQRDGFCFTFVTYKEFEPQAKTRGNLTLQCNAKSDITVLSKIIEGGPKQDILPFDIIMKNDSVRVGFAVCNNAFDYVSLWRDCDAYIATMTGTKWDLALLGKMATKNMPGGMAFDPNDPDRIVFSARVNGKDELQILRLSDKLNLERVIETENTAAMPVFTEFSSPSLFWTEIIWFKTPRQHHLRLVAECGNR